MTTLLFLQQLHALDLRLTRAQEADLLDLIDSYTQDIVAVAECEAKLRDLRHIQTRLVALAERYRNSTTGSYVIRRCNDYVTIHILEAERTLFDLTKGQPSRRARLEELSR